MKKREGIGLRELFERKLEKAEITPSASVRDDLMRKLGRREFVRFNPSHFNVYYLGLIAAAAITAGVLLFSGKRKDESSGTPQTELSPTGKDSTVFRNEMEYDDNAVQGTTITPVIRNSKTHETENTERKVQNREMTTVVPVGVEKALSGKELFLSNPVGRNLQKKANAGEPLIIASATSGCEPLKIHFTTNICKADSCNWSFGDGGYSNSKEPDWIFDEEGQYRVVLTVYHEGAPASFGSVLVTVHPKPQARFETLPDAPEIPGDEIRFLNYSTNATSYKWDFGDGTESELFEPVHKYNRFGSYDVSLVLTSEYGCVDSVFVANAFSGSDYFIEMPNAFIPNPDGPSGGLYSAKSDEAAQIFHPVFEGVTEYQLRIFSKLGLLLFESNDVNIGWDGYFKGQLSNPGVYIWKIRGNYRNGEPFIMMGDVTLLKN